MDDKLKEDINKIVDEAISSRLSSQNIINLEAISTLE